MNTTRAIDRRPMVMAALYALSVALVTLVTALPAHAQTAQQSKMGVCNKEATGKTGDARKAFMSDCLSNKPAEAAKPSTRQDVMRQCNKDAVGKKGDDRKTFMKTCLSAK